LKETKKNEDFPRKKKWQIENNVKWSEHKRMCANEKENKKQNRKWTAIAVFSERSRTIQDEIMIIIIDININMNGQTSSSSSENLKISQQLALRKLKIILKI
jgi:hypothetical protein